MSHRRCQHKLTAAERSWVQMDEPLTDQDAMHLVLDAVPGAQLTAHDANTLRMLGSLRRISYSSPHDILGFTDLDPAQ